MKILILVEALEFIETNLLEPITQQQIADACFCSLSTLQKLFRYALHLSVKEYLEKRRMTLSARDLLSGDAVTEVAFRYQYNSPEVFSRAFARTWGETPSAFASGWKFSGLFPKVLIPELKGEIMMRRKVDISELYDLLRSAQDTYILCFDIRGLMKINGISREAGDMTIVECLKRIDRQLSDGMFLYRVGGDEFALVTGLSDREQVRELGRKILADNDSPIRWNDTDIPVAMWCAAVRIPEGNLRYQELYHKLGEALDSSHNGTFDIHFVN